MAKLQINNYQYFPPIISSGRGAWAIPIGKNEFKRE